jgi:hypothetical protein
VKKLSIDEAPKDGRVCLIGLDGEEKSTPHWAPTRHWAYYDPEYDRWVEVGTGNRFYDFIVKHYYPFPFGDPAHD